MSGNILGPVSLLEDDTYGLEAINDNVDDLDDSILTLTETGGTIATAGGEQTVYTNDAPSALFAPRKFLIDYTNQAAAETTIIKEYYRIKTGGNYIMYKETSYVGVQDPLLIVHELTDTRYGVKVTLELTGGVGRNYDWEVTYDA